MIEVVEGLGDPTLDYALCVKSTRLRLLQTLVSEPTETYPVHERLDRAQNEHKHV